jgi:hypothetical protein
VLQEGTFNARGNDGRIYAVHGYEHLSRVDQMSAGQDHWEPTGQAEYKLADGRRIGVAADGAMRVAGSDLTLQHL